MINIKGSTQTWSKAEQTSSLKSDTSNNVSAAEFTQAFGDKDIGEVLNKVADPNWVDPAKTRQVGNNQLDKDAFLKLLLAQLKYQDPTSPMESHQMAAQLAQFSSLESLSNIDKGISTLTKASAPKNDFQALSLIGKAVSGDSSKISRLNEGDNHELSFNLLGDATEVKLKVIDGNNQQIRELSLNDLKKGKNTFEWNGADEEGKQVPVGEYKLSIEAKSSNGTKVAAQTSFEGKITGVNFTPQGPLLIVGNQTIKLNDVKTIMEPTVSEDVTTSKAVIDSLNSQIAKPAATEGNLTKVGMSREMVNQMKEKGIEAGL